MSKKKRNKILNDNNKGINVMNSNENELDNKENIENNNKIIDKFSLIIDDILKNEGGLSDNIRDKGGITKYGISLRFLKNAGIDVYDIDSDGNVIEKVGDINNDKIVDANDIRLLTIEQAKRIYRKYFYDAIGGDLFNDIDTLKHCLDIYVNSGTKGAILIQKVVNKLNGNIKVDGIIGKKTIEAINKLDKKLFNNTLVKERIAFYTNIIINDSSQRVFYNGWINRAKKFLIK